MKTERAPRTRKPRPTKDARLQIRVTEAEQEQFIALGGAGWLREMLRQERLRNPQGV